MKIKYSPNFLKKFRKLNVRIRKSFNKRMTIFKDSPQDPQLGNHLLEREYLGYRSIDITADWRAVYKEAEILEETIAYFIDIGTHEQLYGEQSEEFSS